MIVLFGIKYAEDLERLKDLKKPRGREGAKYIANNFKGPKREEGSSDTSWVTEIDLGMRLAKKVRYFNRGRVKKKPM